MGTVFVDELAEIRLWSFALAFDRLAKASTFVSNAKSSNCILEVSCSLLSSSSLLLLESVTNLFKPWEILTHEWELSLFTDWILFSTPCVPCKYSWQVTDSVNWENSSVSLVMTYCPTSTVVRNPASVQNLITRFCCGSLSTRSWYFCNRSSCAGSSVKGVGVFITLGTNNGSDCPAKTGLPVLTWQALHSSHKSETAP